MEQKVLAAYERKEFTKGAVKQLRREGGVPAVVYGAKKNIPIYVKENEFETLLRSISESTILTLKIGRKKHEVLVKDYQEDLIKNNFIHIDFYEVSAGKLLRTNVSIVLHGTPKGVKEGGMLEQVMHEVEVECLPKDIPEHFELDVSALEMGDSLQLDALEVPEDVRLMTDIDRTVVTVTAPRSEEEEAEAEEEEMEEPEVIGSEKEEESEEETE